MRYFQLLSQITLTILIILGQNVEENDKDKQKKPARQKLAPFSRYSSIKLAFLVKMAKSRSKDRLITRER